MEISFPRFEADGGGGGAERSAVIINVVLEILVADVGGLLGNTIFGIVLRYLRETGIFTAAIGYLRRRLI